MPVPLKFPTTLAALFAHVRCFPFLSSAGRSFRLCSLRSLFPPSTGKPNDFSPIELAQNYLFLAAPVAQNTPPRPLRVYMPRRKPMLLRCERSSKKSVPPGLLSLDLPTPKGIRPGELAPFPLCGVLSLRQLI